MAYRAITIEQNPLDYFLQPHSSVSPLQVGDVVLRANHDPKEIFARLIRVATDSQWSHSAIVYLVSDPPQGFDNTYLVEAKTKGIHIVNWRSEVVPFDEFTVGIKRPLLDWYVETPYERARHDPHDPEDTHGIAYLRHVRGIAMNQINGLYDNKTVYELTALYAARVARRHLSQIPQVAEAASTVADLFRKWDESDSSMFRFICSGLVQYSFFEALRRRISNDLEIPEHREAALSNLSNLHRIIYREDPEGIIPDYIEQVQSGRLRIQDEPPEPVIDLLKTALPADFNNSPNLQWRYAILDGDVWAIEEAPEGYVPRSEKELQMLQLINPEHASDKEK
ncbi:MAG TPA: hypothetical protein VKX46_06870 [Ktedonobacteraceae bacterium]|nr:hypothetical protein [Ktedonobacteraceae bacterium]